MDTRMAIPSRMTPAIKPPITEMKIKPGSEILGNPNASAIIFARKPRITERMSVSERDA